MKGELVWAYSDFLRAANRNYTANTLNTHRYYVRRFLNWLKAHHVPIGQVAPPHVHAYFRYYFAHARYKRNGKTALHVLKAFCAFAIQKGLMTQDPTEGISLRWLDSPGGFPAYQGALRKILRHPAIMFKYRLPLFSPHWEAFVQRHIELRYGLGSLRLLMADLFHFHRYLVQRGIRSLSHVRPGMIEDFLRHRQNILQRNGAYRHGMFEAIRSIRKHIRWFLRFAFQDRLDHFSHPKPFPDSRCFPRSLLTQFLDFCRLHRGLKHSTLKDWAKKLVSLRHFLVRRGVKDIREVSVPLLNDFFLAQAKRMDGKSVAKGIGAVRAFFKYLYLHDQFPCDISKRLPLTCRFSRDRYPRFLPWAKIQQMLASIDRSVPVGVRDFAILSLVAYHGLRPCEARRLHIADIDWEQSCFTLRERKNGTTARFPLAAHVKEALQAYLRIRPASDDPHFFLRDRAPFRPLGDDALSSIASRHLRKCFGDSLPAYGAYLFRHSFAKALLDGGARLPEIASLLGHRHIDTTFIYTQIDTEGLREIADNYANFL